MFNNCNKSNKFLYFRCSYTKRFETLRRKIFLLGYKESCYYSQNRSKNQRFGRGKCLFECDHIHETFPFYPFIFPSLIHCTYFQCIYDNSSFIRPLSFSRDSLLSLLFSYTPSSISLPAIFNDRLYSLLVLT